MTEELRKELRKEADIVANTPVMEVTFENLENQERKIGAMMEIVYEFDAMRELTGSPNVSRETVEALEKDMVRLVKKFNIVTGADREGGGQ
jgi:hypothetical protein